MKHSNILILTLSLALLLSAASPADARSRSRGRGYPRAIVKPKIQSQGDTIESISGSSITVKRSRETQSYQIDDHTQILLGNQRARVSELRKGMGVSVHPSAFNKNVAQSIIVDNATIRSPAATKTTKTTKPATRRR